MQGEAEPGAQREVPEVPMQDKRLPLAEPPELTSAAHCPAGSTPGLFLRPSEEGCFPDDIVFVVGTSFVPGICL